MNGSKVQEQQLQQRALQGTSSIAQLQDWRTDVLWAESTATSVVEAFLIFQVICKLCKNEGLWWERNLAFLVVFLILFIGASAMGPKLQRIFVGTAARLAGLCALSCILRSTAMVVDSTVRSTGMVFDFSDALLQIVAVYAACLAAFLVVLIMSQCGGNNPRDFGFVPLQASASMEERRQRGSPQEVAGLATMLAVAFINGGGAVFGALVDNIAVLHVFESLPIYLKVGAAIFVTLILGHFWKSFLFPWAAMEVSDHLKDISQGQHTRQNIELLQTEVLTRAQKSPYNFA